jgi:release factor glutamine methyltransferase
MPVHAGIHNPRKLLTQTIKDVLYNSRLDRLDTQILLGYILGLSKVELIIQDNYQLTYAEYQSYVRLHDECLSGRPIAYILGYKEFYSRKYRVTPDTLIPRPETEMLVDIVLDLAKNGDKVLELGTGSGCIAISLKLENQSLDITATDKFEETLKIAIHNATNLGAEIKFIQSDWFYNIKDTYDIIVSNPPYIEVNDKHLEQLSFEPLHALTDFADGLGAIKVVIQNSAKHLKARSIELLAGIHHSKGTNERYLLLEHGYNQGKYSRELMMQSGFVDVRTIKDYANIDRVTIGRMD